MSAGLAIGAALTGISALAGLFGKKKQVSDTTSTTHTTPDYDPQTGGFRNYLLDSWKNRLSGEDNFEDAYKQGGLFDIFDSSRRSSNAVSDIFTSRGINRTGAGASAQVDNSYRNSNSVAKFLSTLPLIYDQRKSDMLGGAGAFLSSLPIGTTTTGTSHTEGEGGPGPLQGAITGGASGLAAFLGQQAANTSLGNILKNIGKTSSGGSPSGGRNSWYDLG